MMTVSVLKAVLKLDLDPVLLYFLPIKVRVEILKVDFLYEVGVRSLFPVFSFVILTVIQKNFLR